MVPSLPYTITAILHEDDSCAVYRGLRPGDHRPVAMKVLGRRWQPRDRDRLRKEYELGVRLGVPAVLRPLALEMHDGAPVLVLEDFEGRSLADLRELGLDLRRFLRVAARLAGAVAAVHARGVIHKDLKPKNVLIGRDDEVRLIDLGLASLLPRERHPVEGNRLVEGSLPYMSPEQTGRTGWPIDARTDLYSLGVTLYEVYASRPPFEADDPLGWVHAHLARVPPPLGEVVPGTPPVLSDIVAKLLAKSPDDRYQSALGLQRDLERCLDSLTPDGRIPPIPLGLSDASDRFQVPNRLYGRERELSDLLASFERVLATGGAELVLVSGDPGLGKTSLIRELHAPIARARSLFLSGKYDPHEREIPYSTLARAFRGLVLDLLSGSEERVGAWRERVTRALGRNGQLIVQVVPEARLLVGPQPPVPELPLGEAKARLHATFRRFVGALALKEHPLVLFLDDLQWADAASLELLLDLLTSRERDSVMLIGAYRANEVAPGHPLELMLASARKADVTIRELSLAPLSREHVEQLVAVAMLREPDEVRALARLVAEKTGGNPYFAVQFLTSLHENGLIRFDPRAQAWTCDVDAARAAPYTDNVVDLMTARIRQLEPQAQEVARLAACAGDVWDEEMLSALLGRSEELTERDLGELLRAGLLDRSGETFRFSHDRVRQAAYALTPEDRRAETHLAIGRLLLARTPADRIGERVFDVVNQLNRGAALVQDERERARLAELDLLAGRRAKASAAYGAAAQYLAAGMAMLPADAWASKYPLALALHLERAQCEYLAGAFGEAERCLALALSHARKREDKAAAHRLRIEVRTTLGEVERAVGSALECAALFGVSLERHPSLEAAAERYASAMRCLGERAIEELIDLPPMSDPEICALTEALLAASPAAANYDERLHLALIAEAAKLSIVHGNAPCSVAAYAHLGTIIGPTLRQYRDGYRFGKLGHDLVARYGWAAYSARSCAMFAYGILPWSRHVREALPYLEQGLRDGVEVGDLVFACYCCCCILSVLLARGDPLEAVDRESERLLGVVSGARYGDVEDALLVQQRLVRRLRGVVPSAAAGAAPAQAEELDERILRRFPTAVCWYHVRTLQERFLLGDHREALAAASRASEVLWTSTHHWERCEHSLFLALTLAALHDAASPWEREEYRSALRVEAERNRAWADGCRQNFANRSALVSAELARVEGRELDAERLYEQAIRSARENGFVQNEAIACEAASKFHRARGFDSFADVYLRQARDGYRRWGAESKARQLELLHPSLIDRALEPGSTFTATPEHLDLLSAVKASQHISGQIEIEALIGTLLKIALEQGGGRRAYLLLVRDDALSIEAEASIEERGIVTRILPSLDAESSSLLPMEAVHRARVSREPVIQQDPAAGGAFASEGYFVRHRPRSVVCVPIMRQELVGVLYLENDLVTGAFTPDRLTTLSLLACQAAISLENARLLLDERQARQRSAFLAEAGGLLSESLDYQETLERLGRACVRSLADACLLDVVEGEHIRRVAGACADPEKEHVLERLRTSHRVRWDSPHPAARCLRDRETVWLPVVTEDALRGLCEGEEHLQLSRALGSRSLLAVPIVARGMTMGALSLFSATAGRFTRADLELAQDIARRAAMAIDNARLYRDAQEGIRLREEFLSVASHELRTPVAGIMLSIESLASSGGAGGSIDPSSSRKLLDLLVRHGRRLARLIGDLLDVSRLQKPLSLEREEVDLVRLVREVLARLEPDAVRARCSVSIQAGGPVTGFWDRSRLDQVITNLLSNAVKFGAGKPIEISVGTTPDGLARLAIRDHGIGISPEFQPRLFGRFERGVSADHYGGLGLGLYISRRIVEAHGGLVRVESQPSAGATFTVDLPCTPRGAGP